MKEIWENIEGYEELYQISNLGNVRSRKSGRILKQRMTEDGYLRVTLSNKGKLKTIPVHRLVAIAFIENPKGKPQVNHKDTNKSNNCAKNLEWSTPQENMAHAKETGLIKNKYLSLEEVKEIREVFQSGHPEHGKEALAKRYEVSESTIYNVITHKGRYKNM